MRIVLAVLAVLAVSLTACGSRAEDLYVGELQGKQLSVHGVRPGFIAINEAMAKLFESCGLQPPVPVNVGQRENDGTGDPVTIALERIAGNIRVIEAAKCVTAKTAKPPRCYWRGPHPC